MSKVAVVYWSGTGNTEAMASYVVKGVQEAGAEATLFTAGEFGVEQMDNFDGEWMRTWEETCRSDGAILVCESVICNEAPDAMGEASCIALGKSLA